MSGYKCGRLMLARVRPGESLAMPVFVQSVGIRNLTGNLVEFGLRYYNAEEDCSRLQRLRRMSLAIWNSRSPQVENEA